MAGGRIRQKGGLTRMITCMIGCLMILLIAFITVNWVYMSTDAISGADNNVFYQNEVKKLSAIPTIPVLGSSSLALPSNTFGEEIQQDLNVKSIEVDSVGEKASVTLENSFSDVSESRSVEEREATNDSELSDTDSNTGQQDMFDTILDKMSDQANEVASHNLRTGEQSNEEESSCQGTALAQSIEKSDFFHLSDFDCSSTNEGWEDHIPPPASNTTRAKRLWLKRKNLLSEFSDQQTNFDFSDPNSKYIVFWPIFAGIGNNLAVFAEVMLIAMLSNRKFLVYDWDTLRGYFYLPFQFEVIKEKVWERDPDTLFVEKTNQCPFSAVDACHGKVDAKFIVMRSTCLTVQQIIKERSDKSWFTDRGVLAKTLISPQEMVHHILRFLYREVMIPRPWVQEQIDDFKRSVDWESKYVVGVHVRTGGLSHEGIRWGRFLNENDVKVFRAYTNALTNSFESGVAQGMNLRRSDPTEKDPIQRKMEAKFPVLWYVVSDQEAIKEQFKNKFGDYVVYTSCEMKHTNKGRQKKADPGFTCALVENYLLSSADTLVLTTRSTYGYLARHRTNVPYVTIDLGDFQKWNKMTSAQKSSVPLSTWTVDDI